MLGCNNQSSADLAGEGGGLRQTIPVKVRTISSRSLERRLELIGIVKPWEKTTLRTEIGGKISKVSFAKGDEVKAGQVLARLDDEQIRWQLRQAEVKLELAQAELAKMQEFTRPQELAASKAAFAGAKAQLEEARLDKERVNQLYRQDMISGERKDAAGTRYQVALSNYRQAKEKLGLAQVGARQEDIQIARQRVKAAEVERSLMQVRLKKTYLKSPLSGEVSEKQVNLGEVINAATPIATIIDSSRVKLLVHIPQQEIAYFKRGDEVALTLDAYPGRSFSGLIHHLGLEADQESRAFPVEVRIDNSHHYLRPGMVARASLVKARYSQALVIPYDAILGAENQFYVFVVANKIAHKRPVSVSLRQDELAVIKSGLTEGEQLVVAGQQNLQHGRRVQVIE